MDARQHEGIVRLIGAISGVGVGALVLALMLAIGSIAGRGFLVLAQLIGLAVVEGPAWLGPAFGAGALLVSTLTGAWLSPRAAGAPLGTAIGGVVTVMGACMAWTLAWTTIRLLQTGGLAAAWFLPVHAALLVLAGLVLPAIGLFLPAALLWAAAVRALPTVLGSPARGR